MAGRLHASASKDSVVVGGANKSLATSGGAPSPTSSSSSGSSALKSGSSSSSSSSGTIKRSISFQLNNPNETDKERKKREKLAELDKKLLGPDGMKALDALSTKDIDRKFKQLISTMGVKEDKWMKGKYTTQEKKELISAIIQQRQEKADTPETYVKMLTDNPGALALDRLEKLCEKLEDSEFVSTFITHEGVVAMFEALLFCLFKSNSLSGGDELDVPRLERLLSCISTMYVYHSF